MGIYLGANELSTGGGSGGGDPVNSVVRLYVGDSTTYTDENGGFYLKTGNIINADPTNYPNAIISTILTDYTNKDLTEESTKRAIALNNDGTKMYIIGSAQDAVKEYSLSTAFNVFTATYTQDFYVGNEDLNPYGITFNSDGTKMYIVGVSTDTVYEYILSTAFNVSTATLNQSFSVAAKDSVPEDIVFNTDGTIMYIAGGANDSIYQYSLSTAFDISTAVFTKSLLLTSEQPNGMAFNSDGTKMYIVDGFTDSLVIYFLSIAFDISTAVQQGFYDLSNSFATPEGIVLSSNDQFMYIVGSQSSTVRQYTYSEKMGNPTDTGANDYIKLK